MDKVIQEGKCAEWQDSSVCKERGSAEGSGLGKPLAERELRPARLRRRNLPVRLGRKGIPD